MTDERVVYICSLSLHLYVLTLLANYTSTERLFSALVYASGHTSFYLTQRAVYALFSFNNSIIIKLFVTHTHDIISDFLFKCIGGSEKSRFGVVVVVAARACRSRFTWKTCTW